MANIVLIDDHNLLRTALASLVKSQGHTVLFEAGNGMHFIEKLDETNPPDLVLLDINMPDMNGFETATWLKQNHPGIKVLALSMYDNESAIIRMLKCGVKGYILKDSDPAELQLAIYDILTKGFYYSELVSGSMMHAINTIHDRDSDSKSLVEISQTEIEFLKHCCTELTYKEIAEKMNVGTRAVEHYRDNLFLKLNLKTRVGLALYAIKNRIVNF